MSIEAMKLALDALKRIEHPDQSDVIDVLRQAIAELESQEPVAKVVLTETLELPCLQWLDLNRQFDFKGGEYLYTHPPQRTEQNFCPRCGKRTKDLTHIHTCTPPPQENT